MLGKVGFEIWISKSQEKDEKNVDSVAISLFM